MQTFKRANFTDLNGKEVRVTEDTIISLTTMALNTLKHSGKTGIYDLDTKHYEYWEDRLEKLYKARKEFGLTTFEAWQARKVAGFGSFHTTLLQAYQLADEGNQRALQLAFPNWFLQPTTY